MSKAKEAQMRAFVKEYPFVASLVDLEEEQFFLHKPKVQRLDLDLLKVRPTNKLPWGPGHARMLFIIGTEDEVIYELKMRDRLRIDPSFFNPFSWITQDVWGETLEDVLLSDSPVVDPDAVKCVFEIESLYFRDDKPHCIRNLTVHKIPKGRKFSEWLDDLDQIADEELQRDIDKIDAA